jgi:hypothetical protein
MDKSAPNDSPITLNNLFQDDSSDSGDLADGLDQFSRFIVWGDVSQEEKERKQSFIEDDELESSICASTFLIPMISSVMMMTTDIHPILSKVFLSAQEVTYGFSLQARPLPF